MEDESSSTISSSTQRLVTRSATIDSSTTQRGRSESRTPNPTPRRSSKRVRRSSFDSLDFMTTLGTDAAADTPHQRKISITPKQVTYCWARTLKTLQGFQVSLLGNYGYCLLG
jgi:hypothetical protein